MIAEAIAGYLAYDPTRPTVPASRKDDLIAEFTYEGSALQVVSVRVAV